MTYDMLLARSVQLVGLFLIEVWFLTSQDLAQIMDIYVLMGPLGHGLGSSPNRIRFDLAQLLEA